MSKFLQLILIAAACRTASVATEAGQLVDVTTQPRFEQRGDFVDLVISDANHSFDISWAMPPSVQFVPLLLDTNKVYIFTVGQRPFRDITFPELRRVQFNGQTIYDIEVCEVHKAKMDHKQVKIVYGLIRPAKDAPSPDTERRLFPHCHEYSLGGCVVAPDSPKTTKVYVCRECKEAIAGWTATNSTSLKR